MLFSAAIQLPIATEWAWRPRDFAQTKDGLKLRYEIRGEGDPLALIMGFSGSSRGWGEPFLSRIEKRFKTILIDNRGTGESDKPDAPWTMTDMANDVAAVLDHAKIPRAHIYGISMGGMIAQEFALSHAARVRGLVLGCTACGMTHGAPTDPENVAKLMPRSEDVARKTQARRGVFSRVRHGVSRTQKRAGVHRSANRRHGQISDHADAYFHAADGSDPGMGSRMTGSAQIKAPTLIFHGDDDRLLPHANAEILHAKIPGSKVHILKGIGHMFFWEAPEESVKIPGDFVAAVK